MMPVVHPGRHPYILGAQMQVDADSDQEDRDSETSMEAASAAEHAVTYEPNFSVINERLLTLYPAVRIESTQMKHAARNILPTHWNPEDKSIFLALNYDKLRVTHRNSARANQNGNNASAVRANLPIPSICGIYYFEVFVRDSPTGCLGVGVCQKGVQTNRLPGWDNMSYGYHGDDGHFFCSSGNGTAYGEKFGTGDTVGCGLNMIENHIFFTKNGVFQGIAMEGLELRDELYPVVGMQSSRESVDVNFGQVPFVYDILESMQKCKNFVSNQIREVELPSQCKRDWCHRMVANFLQTEGYHEAFDAFNNYLEDPAEEPIEIIQARKEIMDLIIAHKSEEAFAMIKTIFPYMTQTDIASRQYAMLLLKIQVFVEEAYAFACHVRRWDSPKHISKFTTAYMGNGNSTSNCPSTSAAGSATNSHKRSRSRHSDNDAPHKKVTPGRTIVSQEDQPCSSKNGNSSNGKSYDKDYDMTLEYDKESNGFGAVLGWVRYDHDEYNNSDRMYVRQLIDLGKSIADECRDAAVGDNNIIKLVEDALPCMYLSKNEFRHHRLLRRQHCISVAKIVNEALMESFHSITNVRAPTGLTLPRALEMWKEKKRDMISSDCSAAVFMNDFEIIYGTDFESDDEEEDSFEESDDSRSSDDEDDEEEDDDEEEEEDGENDAQSDESMMSEGSDDELERSESRSISTSSDEAMDSDQPTHSRAITMSFSALSRGKQ